MKKSELLNWLQEEYQQWVGDKRFPLVNSLTISMMTMSQTYAPGWRERTKS